MVRIALLPALAIAACMPSYDYDRPTLPAASAAQQVACYRAKRYALVRGEATWRKQYSSGTSTITETWQSHGLAFRIGDRVVDAAAVIAALPDRELGDGYQRLLSSTADAHAAYPRWRNLAFGLAGAGLVMVGTALLIAVDDVNSPVITPLALGGAGVAVLSVIPALLAYRSYDGAIEHDLDQHLVRSGPWANRAASAAAAENQRLAGACGLDRGDLPTSPGIERLLPASASSAYLDD